MQRQATLEGRCRRGQAGILNKMEGTKGLTNQGRVGLSHGARARIVVAVAIATAVVLLLVPRIAQSPAYHQFADSRTFAGIPHGLDVLSNLGFVVVGLMGLRFLLGQRRSAVAFSEPTEQVPYLVFFAGVLVTGFGSAYYHLSPDNFRLVWDRVPMTTAFGGFFAAVLAERIGVRAGLRLLPLLVVGGAASVLYWYWGETRNAGDLRPYAFVQFFPILAVPILLGLFPARYTRGQDALWVLAWYGLSKVFEHLDAVLLGSVGISGHTFKHLLAAVGALVVLRMLARRRPLAAAGVPVA